MQTLKFRIFAPPSNAPYKVPPLAAALSRLPPPSTTDHGAYLPLTKSIYSASYTADIAFLSIMGQTKIADEVLELNCRNITLQRCVRKKTAPVRVS